MSSATFTSAPNAMTTLWVNQSSTCFTHTAVGGCDECNPAAPKPWPIHTVDYHGDTVCAKCLTPMSAPRLHP